MLLWCVAALELAQPGAGQNETGTVWRRSCAEGRVHTVLYSVARRSFRPLKKKDRPSSTLPSRRPYLTRGRFFFRRMLCAQPTMYSLPS